MQWIDFEAEIRISAHVKLEKTFTQMKSVFITDRSWKNIGGLPGLCLSMRANGAQNLDIHGPQGCMDIYQVICLVS